MALALNIYKTKVGIASTALTEFYKAPVGYTGVVLLSNVANIGNTTRTITCIHNRPVTVNGITTNVVTESVKEFPIEPNDAVSLFKGKLFLEPGDSLRLSSNSNTDLKYIFSILETLN